MRRALSRTVRLLVVKVSTLAGFLGVAILCGLLCAALAVPVLGSVAYGVSAGARAVTRLPTALAVPALRGRTRVYDRTGALVATFFSQNRVEVPLTRVAPVMQQAMVDIEDERFYQHGALDLKGTLRALANNAQSSSSTRQGGSTLTQQYVKNILVNQATTPAELATVLRQRGVAEKVRELRYAVALEGRLSKRQILEGYLNIAPFGQNVYGVEAASQYYFATSAAKLTVAQAAMLAGEVQAPSLYDPTAGGTHVVQAKDRRDTVLAKMYQLHHIPKATYDAAVKSPLAIHRTEPMQGCATARVSKWYCDYVLSVLLKDPALSVLGASYAERKARVDAGGLDVHTALDPRVQALADAGMATATDPTDTPIASTAVVKPGTGDVLAVSNSKTWGPRDPGDHSTTETDFAIPYSYGGAIGFQPGSGMKPITMAVALEKGLGLDHRIDAASGLYYHDLPYHTCKGTHYTGTNDPILNEGGQSYGSITMAQGIWESVNSYFAQLESQVGLCPVARLAAKLGVTTVDLSGGAHQVPLQQVPTLTLGTNVTSPLQMSEVYATLADRGRYCPPRVVTRIVEVTTGRTLYDPPPTCAQVMPPGVADAISWALFHNVQGDLDPASTATPARLTGIPTAGKTGTNDNHQAVWFNGYTSQFAASVVLAMPSTVDRFGLPTSLKGQVIGGTPIATATGGTAAGGIWKKIMGPVLHAQQTHPGFVRRPADRYGAPGQDRQVTVPDVIGLDIVSAGSEIGAAQLAWTVATAPVASSLPAGEIAATDPAGAAQVAPGSSVTLFLSKGP